MYLEALAQSQRSQADLMELRRMLDALIDINADNDGTPKDMALRVGNTAILQTADDIQFWVGDRYISFDDFYKTVDLWKRLANGSRAVEIDRRMPKGGGGTTSNFDLSGITPSGPITFNSASGVIGIQTASATQSGALSANDWNTFNGKLNSNTRLNTIVSRTTPANDEVILLTPTGIGFTPYTAPLTTADVQGIVLTSLDKAAPITFNSTTGVIGIQTASATQAGALAAADFTTFAGKQNSNTRLNAIVNQATPTDTQQIVLTPTGIGFQPAATAFTTANARSAISGTAPISYDPATGAIGIQTASASQAGALSAADFSTFTGKQNSNTRLNAIVNRTTPTADEIVLLTSTGISFTPYTKPSSVTDIQGIALTSLDKAAPITYNSTTGVIGIQTASASQAGALSAADFSTFAGKQNSSTRLNAIVNRATPTAPEVVTLTPTGLDFVSPTTLGNPSVTNTTITVDGGAQKSVTRMGLPVDFNNKGSTNYYFSNSMFGGQSGGVGIFVDRLQGAPQKYNITTTGNADLSAAFDPSYDSPAFLGYSGPTATDMVLEIDFTPICTPANVTTLSYWPGVIALHFYDNFYASIVPPASVKVDIYDATYHSGWPTIGTFIPEGSTTELKDTVLLIPVPNAAGITKLRFTFKMRSETGFYHYLSKAEYFASRPDTWELPQFLLSTSTAPVVAKIPSLRLEDKMITMKTTISPGSFEIQVPTGRNSASFLMRNGANNALIAFRGGNSTGGNGPGVTAPVGGAIATGDGTGLPLNVVGLRQTGWTYAAGVNPVRSLIPAGATGDQIAARVNALITDLTTHGLIGT